VTRQAPDRYVLLFQDEATFYRQPTQTCLWAGLGRRQPRLRYSHKSNTHIRVIGYLDAVWGAVHSQQASRVTVPCLIRSLRQLSQWYPTAEKIYLVWDNWPVHQHWRVQQALADQPRVEVIWLPTYAPWLNPIEKVWRWLKQSVTHAHPWCDDFHEYRHQIDTALQSLAEGSPQLLTYVGLSK
jgi:hypothetical protein